MILVILVVLYGSPFFLLGVGLCEYEMVESIRLWQFGPAMYAYMAVRCLFSLGAFASAVMPDDEDDEESSGSLRGLPMYARIPIGALMTVFFGELLVIGGFVGWLKMWGWWRRD